MLAPAGALVLHLKPNHARFASNLCCLILGKRLGHHRGVAALLPARPRPLPRRYR
ncbi:MAG TPA: hypothetical protein VE075_06020 [Thermoanaerobaculia bacterium]|nr:hypothetical protein [Thermoanaerobaculia bacterium]